MYRHLIARRQMLQLISDNNVNNGTNPNGTVRTPILDHHLIFAPTGSGVNPVTFAENSPPPLNTNPYAQAGRTQTIVKEA
jgi:hypothetical protein